MKYAANAGALVATFNHATLQQVEGLAEELGRAGALLGDAMAVLRRNFAVALAALAAGASATDHVECRRHLEAAVIAMQCEDALIQMLDSMERRTLQMIDALRHVAEIDSEAATWIAESCSGPVVSEGLAARLRAATEMLDTGIARAGPVLQCEAVAGTVDMF